MWTPPHDPAIRGLTAGAQSGSSCLLHLRVATRHGPGLKLDGTELATPIQWARTGVCDALLFEKGSRA